MNVPGNWILFAKRQMEDLRKARDAAPAGVLTEELRAQVQGTLQWFEDFLLVVESTKQADKFRAERERNLMRRAMDLEKLFEASCKGRGGDSLRAQALQWFGDYIAGDDDERPSVED